MSNHEIAPCPFCGVVMERYRNMYRCDTMRLFPRQCHYEFEATSVNMQRHNDLCARLARVGELEDMLKTIVTEKRIYELALRRALESYDPTNAEIGMTTYFKRAADEVLNDAKPFEPLDIVGYLNNKISELETELKTVTDNFAAYCQVQYLDSAKLEQSVTMLNTSKESITVLRKMMDKLKAENTALKDVYVAATMLFMNPLFDLMPGGIDGSPLYDLHRLKNALKLDDKKGES